MSKKLTMLKCDACENTMLPQWNFCPQCGMNVGAISSSTSSTIQSDLKIQHLDKETPPVYLNDVPYSC